MKRYVIIIPFHNPWDWHTDYTNQTALILSQTHTVICFLWGDTVSLYEIITGRRSFTPIRRTGNLWKIQPLFLLPGKRFIIPQAINIIINACAIGLFAIFRAVLEKKRTLFWFFGYYDPVFFMLPIVFRHWRTVYDCVDIATSPEKKAAMLIRRSESWLLTFAWIVVANSHVLTKRLKKLRSHVHMVPLGFRHEMFMNKRIDYPLPRMRKPVLLYIGALDYRIDWGLLEPLVSKHPSYRFLLFGPVFYDHMNPQKIKKMNRVLNAPNVIHDQVGTQEIPSLIEASDITIIPYDITYEIARYCFPMKFMEYFFGQKPVVTTPIYELTRFSGHVRIGRTEKEWSQAIREILKHPLSDPQKRYERQVAKRHTWRKKLDAIQELMLRYESA